jgi:rhomboid protease GluP
MNKYLNITNLLIIINTVIFLTLFALENDGLAIDSNILVSFGAINTEKIVLYNQWWRLIAGMFLHLDIIHLAINMVSLYIIGSIVQQTYSNTAYLFAYLATGITGSLLSLFLSPYFLLVGASGAIFGLFGLLVGHYAIYGSIPSMSRQSVISNFWIIIGLNTLIGFSITIVDISSHIGGMLSGFIFGYLTSRFKKYGIMIYGCIFIICAIFLYFKIMIDNF